MFCIATWNLIVICLFFQGSVCANPCPSGTYGEGCVQKCSCINGAQCNAVSGVCTCQRPGCTCQSGYQGDKLVFHFWFVLFSHTQRVSVTLAITLCPSSLLSAWTFCFFDFISRTAARICFKFYVDVLKVNPTKFVKIRVLPLLFMELWVILCNFWQILQKSSIKQLSRNHSYLVWRVPRGSSF